VKLVMPVHESALVRDEAGRVLCEFCGEVMQAWSPIDGATWYECDCGEVMVVVGGASDDKRATATR
jgi:hypothetical protein